MHGTQKGLYITCTHHMLSYFSSQREGAVLSYQHKNYFFGPRNLYHMIRPLYSNCCIKPFNEFSLSTHITSALFCRFSAYFPVTSGLVVLFIMSCKPHFRVIFVGSFLKNSQSSWNIESDLFVKKPFNYMTFFKYKHYIIKIMKEKLGMTHVGIYSVIA